MARDDINQRCYNGGDHGHRTAAEQARIAGANCLEFLWKLMKQNPTFIDPNNP